MNQMESGQLQGRPLAPKSQILIRLHQLAYEVSQLPLPRVATKILKVGS